MLSLYNTSPHKCSFMKQNNDLQNLPIGIFDSGMGGLTVLKCLKEQLPKESFVYLGDTARLPYGTKSKDTVVKYAVQMANLLIEQNIKLMVVACNTASMAALDHLQAHMPHIPIVGVIKPGAKALVENSPSHQAAVLATEATINSNIYPNTIKAIDSNMEITSLACGLFVALAEEGCVNDDIAKAAIKKYLHPLLSGEQPADAILLGCTHFPVLMPAMKEILGPSVNIIDSAHTTAEFVTTTLATLNLHSQTQRESTKFFVTDSPERFSRIGKLFYGNHIPIDAITLVNGNGYN